MTAAHAMLPVRDADAAGRNSIQPNPLLDLVTSAPALPKGIVRRPALVQGLADAEDAALALIVGPPGYGKSALLAEWAELDERPFAWLALGRPGHRAISALSAARSIGASERMPDLVRRIRATRAGFVLVLDDAHLLPPSVLRDIVELALEELPAGSTLAVASRIQPALPIGRLRAHRLLGEIGVQQLAMSSAEAAVLLRSAGLELESDQVEALVRRTEGWAAALYLAALALRLNPDGVATFGGRHHLLSGYVRDEVLTALPADLLSFSLTTSVLDELSGPVCDAALDGHGSARVIERLARATGLLVPVDAEHKSYRWHTLMREALQGELQRIKPELERVARLRACRWYAGHGDTELAIEQAAAARDAELTGTLLWPRLLAYFNYGRNNLVAGWLASFSDDQIAECPPLALSAALSALIAGNVREAQRWSMVTEAAIERQSGVQWPASLATGLSVIEATVADHSVADLGRAVMSAADAEPRDSPWLPVCRLLIGVAMYLQGEVAAAELSLEDGVRLSANEAPTMTSLCLAQRAMMEIERENWQLAADLTDRAAMVVAEWRLEANPVSALVLSAAAASRAQQGRIDEAKRDLRRGIERLAELGDFVPWYGAEARILLAYASLWLADVVGARTLLAEASRQARQATGATAFTAWFDRAWEHLDTLAETSLAGASSLTIAELRILRFLPSHRSLREIGTQLGVSANTVKTQAHAVYRKLGVANRSEAVTRGLEAGLLER